MKLDENYPIDRITAILSLSEGSYEESEEGYFSVISIPLRIMESSDIHIVSNYLKVDTETFSSNYGKFYIRGNDKTPIVFENASDALGTAQQQNKHLVQKFLYAIYRDTGIKFNPGFKQVTA